MKILVLGANGMLGNAMMRVLSDVKDYDVFGTVRSAGVKRFFAAEIAAKLTSDCDVENHDSLVRAFNQISPDVVINCIGLIKQVAETEEPLQMIPINSLLPHRLQKLCSLSNARLIHFSTDCVFNGASGNYVEDEPSDAEDLYGRSKYLGEVVHETNAITLRTSIIGHELQSSHGLIGWFLSQKEKCLGFRQAIFSGLPTVVVAAIIRDFIIPNPELSGLYHLAAEPISKYDLLKIVARVYGKVIDILPDDTLVINRSLNSVRFEQASGYRAPSWEKLIEEMRAGK